MKAITKAMKKLIISAAVLLSLGALAETETVNGITWEYTVSDGEASVAGYWASPAINTLTAGAIIIPSTLGGYPVTSIGNSAFYGCSGLTSVTIPDSVTSIGWGAFYGCSGLTSIAIPDSVTVVDVYTFYGCSGLTSVTIPNSVTIIGEGAFESCSGLTSVTIPDSVTSIEACAFYGCSGLTSVTIPDSMTSIEAYAFYGCSGLTSVTIPDSVTRIGEGAFERCSGLTSVTIPNSVTIIWRETFYGCSSLTSVTIPDSVTSIGDWAFVDCSGLTSVTIPTSVTSTGLYTFKGCSNLESVVFCGNPPNCAYDYICDSDENKVVVGIYSAEYAEEWGSVISDDGYWHGLKMKMRGDPRPRTYTITYDSNGGTGGVGSQTAIYGGGGVTIDDGGTLHWEEHYFMGWAYAQFGTPAFAGGEDSPEQSCTLYAQWAKITPASADWEKGTFSFEVTGLLPGDYEISCCNANDYAAGTGIQWKNVVADIEFTRNQEGRAFMTDKKFASRLGGVVPLIYRVKNDVGCEAFSKPVRTRYGIFVGLGESNASSAEMFYEYITKQGGVSNKNNAHLLTNEKATYKNVKEAFETIANTIKPGDVCTLYFATHGAYTGTATTGLYLYDKPSEEGADLYHEALLARHIRSLDPKGMGVAIVSIINACHSGSLADGWEEQYCRGHYWCENQGLDDLNLGWITAADAASVAYSYFAEFLVKYGLKQGWAAKFIESGTIFTYDVLAKYTHTRYKELLADGWKNNAYINGTSEVQILKDSVLKNVVVGTYNIPTGERPTNLKLATNNKTDRIEVKLGADAADTCLLFYRFVNDVSAEYTLEQFRPYRITDMDTDSPGVFRHSSEQDPIEFYLRAYNGAGVSYIGPKNGWRTAGEVEHIVSGGTLTSVKLNGAKEVTLSKDVERIAANAFAGCSGIEKITFDGDAPTVETGAFSGVGENCIVFVSSTSRGWGVAIPGVWNGLKIEYDDVFPSTPTSTSDPEPTQSTNPVIPDSIKPAPVNPKPDMGDPDYAVIEAKDIVEAFEAPKATVLTGAVYDGNEVVGIVELKLGKVNAKKGSGKVSGSVTTLDGKKHAIKAVNVTGIDGESPASVALSVKDLGTMNVTVGGAEFAGDMGGYHVQSADVGGAWSGRGAAVTVEADDVSMFAGTVLEGLLPDAEQATASGGKWKFAKATSVKWAKPKKGAALPELYDEASGKGLVVDESGGKTNRSAMKLTYTPKKGIFKGSFKVYALEGEGKATKLKKFSVKITGVVADGVGHGIAILKKPAASWPVTVR